MAPVAVPPPLRAAAACMPPQNDNAAAPAAGVGYPAREGLPGEGYPGKFTCPGHQLVVGADTVRDALPIALDAPCWATRGTDTPGSRASGPHVPRSYCKTGAVGSKPPVERGR